MCHGFEPCPVQGGEQYTGGATLRPRDQRNFGALRAIDPLTGQMKWEFRYPTTSASGVLTTALRCWTEPHARSIRSSESEK